MVHRRLLIRVERVDGVHKNLERIMRKRFFALTRQSYTDASPVHLGSVAVHRVGDFGRISPDDVKFKMLERDRACDIG